MHKLGRFTLATIAKGRDYFNKSKNSLSSKRSSRDKKREKDDNHEVLNISTGQAERPKIEGEVSGDVILNYENNMLFGVFDGVGSTSDPRLAADMASRAAVGYYYSSDEPRTHEHAEGDMRTALGIARSAVVDMNYEGNNSSTVGTLVKVERTPDGEKFLTVGQVGDTRMFIYNKKTKELRSITEDQSEGNYVLNHFGSENASKDQILSLVIEDDDRIMICSDGITGDFEDQFLSDEEMKRAFQAKTPQECADEFMRISKKKDDKSVLIIDCNF